MSLVPPDGGRGENAIGHREFLQPVHVRAPRTRAPWSRSGQVRVPYRMRSGEIRLQLKPLQDQVIVITGASSGIGLTTARLAAARGDRVVLAARDEGSLREVAERLRAKGGEIACAVADVADEITRRTSSRERCCTPPRTRCAN